MQSNSFLNHYISFTIFAGLTALTGCTLKKGATAPAAVTAVQEDLTIIPERREFPVNTAVNPCDDFYEYACSIPLSKFQLRPDRSRHIFTFNDSAERLLTKKTAFLEKLVLRTDLTPRTRQLKDNFLACMDTAGRMEEEKENLRTVGTVLTTITKEEPASHELLRIFLGLVLENTNEGLIQIATDANMNDPLKYDLLPQPTVLTFPDQAMYKDEESKKDLSSLYAKFLTLAHIPDASARSQAVVDLETKLAAEHQSPNGQRQRETEPRYKTIKEFTVAYPNLIPESLISEMPATTLVRDLYPEAFKAISIALKEESVQTLKDFIFIRLYAFQIEEIDAAYAADALAFSAKYLGAAPVRAPLKERCTNSVMEDFGKELDFELMPELFPNFPKEKFVTLVNRVRGAIVQRLEKNTWLTAEGKEGALKKMKAARLQVVRPDTDEEWAFLPVQTYSPTTPLENRLLHARTELKQMLKGLKEGRNPSEWHMTPTTVNAYYNPPDNQFVMPQGILQYPFYDADGPEAANFGAVGVVVGHELGHGVDDQGSKYDENGILREWMPEADRAQFKLLTKILVDQFNPIGASINPEYGALTLGENIADNSGLSFSYDAAFPENKGSLEDKRAFYLQYARVWCGTMRDTEYDRRLRKDPHAQTRTRVNFPVVHQTGFYEAYSCQPSDAMYLAPEKRMSLW